MAWAIESLFTVWALPASVATSGGSRQLAVRRSLPVAAAEFEFERG